MIKTKIGTTEPDGNDSGAKISKPKIDLAKLRRDKPPKDDSPPEEKPANVSAGPLERVTEYVFNPSKEKIREVTVVDRMQGRLLPQLDVIDAVWQYVVEVALFRQDANEYEKIFKKKRPIPPNLIQDFIYRTAQWQKSIEGLNLKSGVDLALAEMESRSDNVELQSGDGFGD